MKQTESGAQAQPRFTKAQLRASAAFRHERDLLDAVLTDGETYTAAEVRARMRRFLKGKVT